MKVLHADHPLILTAISAVDRVLEIELVQSLLDKTEVPTKLNTKYKYKTEFKFSSFTGVNCSSPSTERNAHPY